MSQVLFTKSYDKFQFFIGNRKIYRSHVDQIKSDHSFKEKFQYCPIRVNKDLYIVDGQHRFLAAKELDTGIHYFIDPKANLDDIKACNCNVLPWKTKEHIEYYAEKGDIVYKLLKELPEKYKVPHTYVNLILYEITRNVEYRMSKTIKNGNLKLDREQMDLLENICEFVFTSLKNIISLRGKKFMRFAFHKAYIFTFSKMYSENFEKLKQLFEKLKVSKNGLDYAGNLEEAITGINKVIRGQFLKNIKEQ